MTYYSTEPTDDLDIDLSAVEEQHFDLIPPGDYAMQCVAVDIGQSKAGYKLLKAQYQILGGEYDNRRLFETFNIGHSNPVVVGIAQRDIKSWVMACGYTGNERLNMALLRDLEGREFLGQVKIEKDKTGQYQDSNRIRAYKPLPGYGAAPAQPAPTAPPRPAASAPMPPPTAQPAAGGGAKARPWER